MRINDKHGNDILSQEKGNVCFVDTFMIRINGAFARNEKADYLSCYMAFFNEIGTSLDFFTMNRGVIFSKIQEVIELMNGAIPLRAVNDIEFIGTQYNVYAQFKLCVKDIE